MMPVNTRKASSVCFGISNLIKEIKAHHPVERDSNIIDILPQKPRRTY
jgi:hypothetical protein